MEKTKTLQRAGGGEKGKILSQRGRRLGEKSKREEETKVEEVEEVGEREARGGGGGTKGGVKNLHGD